METRGQQIHVEQNEARSGSTPRIVRYVLGISLALAIIALTAIWVTGALTAPDGTGAYADTHRAVQDANDDPQTTP